MTGPKRIQRSRAKGSRIPAGAVSVTRPGRWGNPFEIGRTTPANWPVHGGVYVRDQAHAVELFRDLLAVSPAHVAEASEVLAGRDLACWCPLPAEGEPDICHAAVWLEAVNPPTTAVEDLARWMARNDCLFARTRPSYETALTWLAGSGDSFSMAFSPATGLVDGVTFQVLTAAPVSSTEGN